MKWLLNGEEVELEPVGAEISTGGDRLHVRTAEGTFSALVRRQGESVWVSYRGQQVKLEPVRGRRRAGPHGGNGEVRSPMPGLIVEVRAEVGQTVTKGRTLVILEAMKTRQPMVAPLDGTVKSISVSVGQQVVDAELLAVVEPS